MLRGAVCASVLCMLFGAMLIQAAPTCQSGQTLPSRGANDKWYTKKHTDGYYHFFNDAIGSKPVQLKGISFTGHETGTRETKSGGGFWLFDSSTSSPSVYKSIARNVMDTLSQQWKASVVRIPVCGSGWLQNYAMQDWGANQFMSYRDWVDMAVCEALSQGSVVIIDLHLWAIAKESSTTRNAGIEDGCTGINKVQGIDSCAPKDWFGAYTSTRTGKSWNMGDSKTVWQCSIANADGCTLDNMLRGDNQEHFLDFWYDIANHYKDTPYVFLELFNEPYERKSASFGSEFGDNKAEVNYQFDAWARLMAGAVNVIRNAGATNIVLVGGLDWAYDYLGVGQGPVANASNVLWPTANIGYVFHPYQHGACCGKIGTSISSDLSRSDPLQSGYCLFRKSPSPSMSALPVSGSCDSGGYADTQPKKAPPCLWKATATDGKSSTPGVCAGDPQKCLGLSREQCENVDWSLPTAGGWSQYVLPMAQYGPLVATEFGSFDCSSAFVDTLLKWMNMFGVSYTVWAVWPQNSGGPGNGACGYPSIVKPSPGSSDGYGKGTINCGTLSGCKQQLVPLPFSGTKVFSDMTGVCNPNPCKNGGYCTADPSTLSYLCDCTYTGFSGSTCSVASSGKATPCAPNPCLNGGQCEADAASQPVCTCSVGYTGNRCQTARANVLAITAPDACKTATCQHGGKCLSIMGVAVCNCTGTGYVGDACQIQIGGVTPPPANACSTNNGGCGSVSTTNCLLDGNNNVLCVCKSGFIGNPPSVPCATPPPPNACATDNGGCGSASTTTCLLDSNNNVLCVCKSGFIGNPPSVPCATPPPPNACATNNGGCGPVATTTCLLDSSSSAVCLCKSGYIGNPPSVPCYLINPPVDASTAPAPPPVDASTAPVPIFVNGCQTNNGGCGPVSTTLCAAPASGVTSCSCLSGYVGNPPTTPCAVPNACATNNGGCGPASTTLCTRLASGDASCSCLTGFVGNPPTTACAVLNECATNNGGCGSATTTLCTRLATGAASCSCLSGYTGNPPTTACAKEPPPPACGFKATDAGSNNWYLSYNVVPTAGATVKSVVAQTNVGAVTMAGPFNWGPDKPAVFTANPGGAVNTPFTLVVTPTSGAASTLTITSFTSGSSFTC